MESEREHMRERDVGSMQLKTKQCVQKRRIIKGDRENLCVRWCNRKMRKNVCVCVLNLVFIYERECIRKKENVCV